ncbi:unnamed protein product, partial [Rotaria sp. Silwood2]
VWSVGADVWSVVADVWSVVADVWSVVADVWSVVADVWSVVADVWSVLPCSMNNSLCTADEQMNGLWKLVYTFTNQLSCQSLQETYASIYSNFYEKCNMTMPTIGSSIPTIEVTTPTISFTMPSTYTMNMSTVEVRLNGNIT